MCDAVHERGDILHPEYLGPFVWRCQHCFDLPYRAIAWRGSNLEVTDAEEKLMQNKSLRDEALFGK